MWEETFFCSQLRALAIDKYNAMHSIFTNLIHPNQANLYLLSQIAVRKLNPLPTLQDEQRLLNMAQKFFRKGFGRVRVCF